MNPVVKPLPLILAVFAAAFIAAHLWLGPIYKMYDACACGRHRTWISFNENSGLKNSKFFLHLTSPGNSQHQHEYSDPTHSESSILAYTGVTWGLIGVVVGVRPRKKNL